MATDQSSRRQCWCIFGRIKQYSHVYRYPSGIMATNWQLGPLLKDKFGVTKQTCILTSMLLLPFQCYLEQRAREGADTDGFGCPEPAVRHLDGSQQYGRDPSRAWSSSRTSADSGSQESTSALVTHKRSMPKKTSGHTSN